MKLLVYSDVHASPDRLHDVIATENWITKLAEEKSIDLVLFLGDRFKLRSPEGWLRDEMDKLIFDRDSRGIKSVYLVGNHDQYEKRQGSYTSYGAVRLFGKMLKNTIVVDSVVGFRCKDCEFYAYPYASAIALPTHQLYIGETTDVKFKIALVHGIVEGAVFSNNYMAQGAEIKWKALEDIGVQYVFAGDIHKKQVLQYKDKIFGFYPGAALALDKGDCNEEKGCMIVDTDKNEIKFVENPVAPKFLRFFSDNLKESRGAWVWVDAKEDVDVEMLKKKFGYARVFVNYVETEKESIAEDIEDKSIVDELNEYLKKGCQIKDEELARYMRYIEQFINE